MADTNVQIKLQLSGATSVKVGLEQIGAAAGALKSRLLPLGAALAGAAGLGSLGAAALNTAKLGGELSDLSARTGIATRSLIVLRQAFTDTGVGADGVGKYVNKLQQSLVNAAENGGEAAQAFQSLGLNANELSTLAPEEQFARIGAAIGSVQDPARKTAAVLAIFGKSAGDLLPLFADGGAIDNANSALGKMPDVLARNVPLLDEISDIFDRLPLKATQLFAGILDQLGPTVRELLKAFESIDFTPIGQKIGAFVGVAIDEFRAGKFGEFIGDVIEAGFEIGIEGGANLFSKLANWLGSGDFWIAVGNALFTAINNSLAASAQAVLYLNVPFQTVSNFLQDSLIYAFKTAWDFFAETGIRIGNSIAQKLNEILGTSFGMADVGGLSFGSARAPSMGKAWDDAVAAAKEGTLSIKGFFDESTQAYRELTGSGFAAPTGARNRLGQKVANRIANADIPFEGPMPSGAQPEKMRNIRAELQAQELAYQERLMALRNQSGSIEANWLLTNNQKRERRLEILDKEVRLIDEQISALEQLRIAASDEEKAQIDRQIATLRGQQGGLRNQAMAFGPDLNSFSEQWAAALTKLQDQFLTVAQFTARAFTDAFNAATSSISAGIQGLIYGTETWGQALLNIGQSVVQSIVRAFSDMVAQWIMTHVLMKGVSLAWSGFQSMLRAKDVAEANATETAKTPALAVNATLASVASYGVAAVIGIAAIAGILAAVGAFKEGGYTGDGSPDAVAGVVHRGEFVVPADAVDRIGIGTLESMTAQAQGGSTAVTTVTSSASPITLNMGVFDDPARLSAWARSSEGRTVLVDVMRQHAHEI